ncbi:MAG: hypothetical protein ACR2G7_08950 [Acidimicrobiales bacterium]
MTSARRLFTAGGVALVSLLLVAPPAPAAEDPTIEWTRPTTDDVYLRSPEPVTGTVNGDTDDPIKSITFTLDPVDPNVGPCPASIPEDDKTIEFDPPKAPPFDFEVPVGVPCNRRYKVTATLTRPGLSIGGLCGLRQCEVPVEAFEFAVAIPPGRVTGLAATPYDPATKQVRLTWDRLGPEPPDFLRYEVSIDPPGTANSKILSPDPDNEPSFVYTVADGDQGPHNFRVRAVRKGPDANGPDSEVFGPASGNVQAGPEPPPGQPPSAEPGGGFDPSPGTNNAGPPAKPRTRTTADTGFSKNLPFDPSQTTTVPPTSSTTAAPPPPEDAAVLAIDDNRDQDTRRATVVPVAGGLVLLMGAAHLRLLSKRAEEPEIPIRYR